MDEVTIYANEGGDTEPETAKVIAERNKALQTLIDKNREAAQTRKDAEAETYANQIAAEREVAESTNALVTGEPVVTPPEKGKE